jgi:signal transduction histidine kinase
VTGPRSAPQLTTLSAYGRVHEIAGDGLGELPPVIRAITGAPLALVALLDDRRQRFVGILGLDDVTARHVLSFCSYALLQDGVFAISDLVRRAEFESDPIVTKGLIRSAAASTIKDGAGMTAGVICAFFPDERAIDSTKLEGLGAVARQATTLLSLQRGLATLREKHRLHLETLDTLQGLFRAASRFAIVATDTKGLITAFNVGAESMLRLSADELIGRTTPMFFLVDAEVRARARALPPELLAQGPIDGFEVLAAPARAQIVEEREWTARRGDGTTVPISLVVECVVSEEQELVGYVAIAQDLTERHAADAIKRDFISVVSHELRTPLTSILGALGLLAGGVAGAMSERGAELVRIAHDNGERLLRLVNDILDLQKIEAGHGEFVMTPTDLRVLVHRAVETDRPFAERLDVKLELAPIEHEIVAPVDERKILQVLSNLISNAAKVSPRGGTVTVGLEATASAARLFVQDRGPGIPEAVRARLFGKFVQADVSGRREGGTGLGLSIVRSIVEHHAGRITFDTNPSTGTTFWVELPLTDASRQPPSAPLSFRRR